MIYCYKCNDCGLFEVERPMAHAKSFEFCPQCGRESRRRYTPINFTFGWRLSDKSHEKYQPDELIRNI